MTYKHFAVSDALHRRVKAAASLDGKSVSEWLEEKLAPHFTTPLFYLPGPVDESTESVDRTGSGDPSPCEN